MTTGEPSRAEELYAAFLARVEGGESLDFESFCRDEAPKDSWEELRRIHEAARELPGLLRHLLSRDSPGPSVTSRIHLRYGPGVNPRVDLGDATEEAPAPGKGRPAGESPPPEESPAKDSRFARDVLRRLGGRPGAFGRYALRGEVARGGMGAILRVWDGDLRRHLAMKVVLGKDGRRSPPAPPPPEGGAPPSRPSTPPVDSRTLARFLEEAQVTGQLDHPGIVPVHELGLDPWGRCYFTMKLVKGRTLESILGEMHDPRERSEDGRRTEVPSGSGAGRREKSAGERTPESWSQVRVLGVLHKVCDAVAYAHAKGVVHRDLKPANIMVGRFGEVYVMDWGLAKVLGNRASRDRPREEGPSHSVSREVDSERRERGEAGDPALLTRPGTALGTPVYMPPEQAEGRIEDIGPAADVYAVGAMLYHLLGRQRPYVDPGSEERRLSYRDVLRRVREGPPKPLERIAPRTPPELLAITAKAMARDPAQRYPDMRALAADIAAYLEGRVVSAYETGTWAELRKWIRRNPAWSIGSAAALLAVVAGLMGFLAVRAFKSAQTAEQRRIEAEKQTEIARQAEGKAREERDRADRESREAKAAREEAQKARENSEAVLGFVQSVFDLHDPERQAAGSASIEEALDERTRELEQGVLSASQPLVRARIQVILGSMYRQIGKGEKAERLFSEALRVQRETPEAKPLDRASTAFRLGGSYLGASRLSDAEPLLREAWDTRREVLGEDDLSALRAASDLGLLYLREDRLDDAAPLLERATRAFRESLGADEPLTLAAIHRSGLLAAAQHRWDDAEGLLREALEGSVRVLGEEHRATASVRDDLTRLYEETGAPEKARPLLEEALGIARRRGGKEGPSAALVVRLARVSRNQGDLQSAEKLLQEVRWALQEGAGSANPEALPEVETELGAVYREEGSLLLAGRFLENALKTARDTLGEGHAVTRAAMLEYASLLRDRGSLDEAKALARDLLEALDRNAAMDGGRAEAERARCEELLESIEMRRRESPE